MSQVEEGNAADGVPQLEVSIVSVADVMEDGISGRCHKFKLSYSPQGNPFSKHIRSKTIYYKDDLSETTESSETCSTQLTRFQWYQTALHTRPPAQPQTQPRHYSAPSPPKPPHKEMSPSPSR